MTSRTRASFAVIPVITWLCAVSAAPAVSPSVPAQAPPSESASGGTANLLPFRITVVDSQTGRGVPLVELATINGIVHVTDSAGVVAFQEPGLMDQDVFFFVKSHGYTFPKDGFEMAGTALRVTAGGSGVIKVDRVNIAERLYRVTGAGIYRDSVMLKDRVPISEPLLNGRVFGQDSVQCALYGKKIYWFWGDTGKPSYPLGNFAASGAVSQLPPQLGGAGLDPAVGVDLKYFVGPDGFSRGMCPIEGQPGPVWFDGLLTVADAGGRERMICHFARIKTLGEMYEHGAAVYDDDKEKFEPVNRIALDAPLFMRGIAMRSSAEGGDYWYFCTPFPYIRCRANYNSLIDPAQYEAYTCLQSGERYDPKNARLERDGSGGLGYGWKRDTGVVLQKEQSELIAKGLMKPEEAAIQLRDAETGKAVQGHSGSVFWNDYRKRWIMIAQELYGTSFCGEVWYAEAPALTGPWGKARKIITHDDYSFYNVVHHPFFDKNGGRIIFLEGTYTMAFSGTKIPTPRYDYNQIMYRLDLGDARLRCD